jgi:transcriptional regulator with XRE-family HTH domain
MPRRIQSGRRRRPTFIRQWREYRDLTQERIAELLGASKPTISRIESGKQPYTQDVLEALADILDAEPADLLTKNPQQTETDTESLLSLWTQAKATVRRQLLAIAEALVKQKDP